MVSADSDGFVALYRRGQRIVGALTVDRPRDIMKYRRRIADRGAWDEGLAYSASGRAARTA